MTDDRVAHMMQMQQLRGSSQATSLMDRLRNYDRMTAAKDMREAAASIIVLKAALLDAADRIEALEAAARDFIAKVDRGEARSADSYAKFKAALAPEQDK